MALLSCLVAVAAFLVCGATARPQRIAVFESIIFNNETAALLPPSAMASRFNMKTRGACSSGPVYAPPCSDSFPLTTLEAESVVQFIVPGSPFRLNPLAICGWEFQGPSDRKLYITCETASFFFGQYFLVWENDAVTGVHNQQNVDIKYQFTGSSGRVGVRTLSKSFYAAISCAVTVVAGPGATAGTDGVTPAGTDSASAGTDATPAAESGTTFPPETVSQSATTPAPEIVAEHGTTFPPETVAQTGSTPAPEIVAQHGTTFPPETVAQTGSTPAPEIVAQHGTTFPPETVAQTGSTPAPEIVAQYGTTFAP